MPRSYAFLLTVLCLLVLPLSSLWPAPAAADVPSPTIEGPVTGGLGEPFLATTAFDLGEVGYTQAEYFVSGTARSYVSTDPLPLSEDGVWNVEVGEEAEYETRIVVYRPAKRGHFNGTVVVEWLNVSGGLDSAPDWLMAHTELLRRGYAWVGVTAQKAGVDGGFVLPGLPSQPLKTVDPDRYGSLVHPGDSFSYDIFSQVGEAILRPTGLAPLGELQPKRILGIGESQSAIRLTTYVNAVHPHARIYDGFFIHSRFASSAGLSEPPQAKIDAPGVVLIRNDLETPILIFETETDLVPFANYRRARQPDTDFLRLWEVAGTAHADTYFTNAGMTDRGDDPSVTRLIVTTMPVEGFPIACPVPINSGPQHWVVKAAIAALNRWVKTGRPPAERPRIEFTTTPPVQIVRDAFGNAVGGIRTPALDVPIATLSGQGQVGSILCILFGSTDPFDDDLLDELYPDKCEYLRDYDRSTFRTLLNGDILIQDAWLLHQGARLFGPGADADCGRKNAHRKRSGWRMRGWQR